MLVEGVRAVSSTVSALSSLAERGSGDQLHTLACRTTWDKANSLAADLPLLLALAASTCCLVEERGDWPVQQRFRLAAAAANLTHSSAQLLTLLWPPSLPRRERQYITAISQLALPVFLIIVHSLVNQVCVRGQGRPCYTAAAVHAGMCCPEVLCSPVLVVGQMAAMHQADERRQLATALDLVARLCGAPQLPRSDALPTGAPSVLATGCTALVEVGHLMRRLAGAAGAAPPPEVAALHGSVAALRCRSLAFMAAHLRGIRGVVLSLDGADGASFLDLFSAQLQLAAGNLGELLPAFLTATLADEEGKAGTGSSGDRSADGASSDDGGSDDGEAPSSTRQFCAVARELAALLGSTEHLWRHAELGLAAPACAAVEAFVRTLAAAWQEEGPAAEAFLIGNNVLLLCVNAVRVLQQYLSSCAQAGLAAVGQARRALLWCMCCVLRQPSAPVDPPACSGP